MEKQEILNWCGKHDSQYAPWIQKEREIGNKLRKTKELTKADLIEIIKWKFEGLEGRKKRELNHVANIHEQVLKNVSNIVFSLDTSQDKYKVKLLCVFDGIGGAVASTILTFFDPENYGVFDIHVWREIFGKDAKSLDYSPRNYVKLLSKLREIANRYGLEVRTVEKAFYKKNYDESKKHI
jgi:serine/threonine protein phosphatase PrpC